VSRRAAVVGIGQTPFAKDLGMTEARVAALAITNALADAGLRPSDVDGIVHYDIETTSAAEVAAMLGMANVDFLATMSHGGGAYCGLLQTAVAAVEAGYAHTVLVYRARNRGRKSAFGAGMTEGGRPWEKVGERIAGMAQYQVPFGVVSPAQEMALLARRHMIEHGTTEEHFAEVACAIRSHAVRNPNALMRTPITVEDHHASRWIAEPLRLLDCCLETDGGCALVVTSAERARDRSSPPVWVLATAQCAGPAHHRPTDWFATDRRRMVAAGARRLWEAAGVAPADVDAAMVYDHFTPMVLVTLEDWGFCGLGEGGPFAASGALRWPDGALPVNTNGGQLSEAFVHGMNNVLEAVRQVRGTSTCQVADAEVVFVAAAGSDPHGAVLLGR
jgi:acetyl-CoA acetyltransferase